MNAVFQAGGALPTDHLTYVERQADHYALSATLNSEYLHLIAPRQVGKTSLLKHLAAKLGKMGWRCAYVDLSTLMDLSKPEWYAELGKSLAKSLTPEQMPTLRNQIDLRSYLLNQTLSWPGVQPYIALFFDEVEGAGKARDSDGTSFSDTFFMTLRNLYIQRDDYEGTVVVALAGAIDPGELVKDPVISPFNVGQEISLDDFTSTETRTLTENLVHLGLPVEEAVHQAIYNWTNGHPYLTQRVCAELERIAHQGGLTIISPDNVEYVVEQVILSRANPLRRDKNIKHIIKMLNRLSARAAKLWSRLKVDETIPLIEASDDVFLELYLTGAVKSDGKHLVIRNRIYAEAFSGSRMPKREDESALPCSNAQAQAKYIVNLYGPVEGLTMGDYADVKQHFDAPVRTAQGSWETLIAQVTARIDALSVQLGQNVGDLKRGQVALYRQVDQAYRDDLARILAVVQQGRMEQGGMQATLDAVRRAIQVIMERGLPMDAELRVAVADLTEAVESSLRLERKLELSLPLIPALLDYKIELMVDSEVDLHDVWNELRQRWQRLVATTNQ